MPLYTFRNKNTEEVIEKTITISQMQEFVESGEWEQIIGAPSLITHTGNMVNKTPDSWKSHLKGIKKAAGTRVENTVKL